MCSIYLRGISHSRWPQCSPPIGSRSQARPREAQWHGWVVPIVGPTGMGALFDQSPFQPGVAASRAFVARLGRSFRLTLAVASVVENGLTIPVEAAAGIGGEPH